MNFVNFLVLFVIFFAVIVGLFYFFGWNDEKSLFNQAVIEKQGRFQDTNRYFQDDSTQPLSYRYIDPNDVISDTVRYYEPTERLKIDSNELYNKNYYNTYTTIVGGNDTNTVTAGWTNSSGKWLVDLNTTGVLKSDSNKLCDSSTCYSISDLNITGGGSSQWTTVGTEIYYDGNVGINVHNPTTALDINGTATLRDIGTSLATTDANVLVDGNFQTDPTGIWTIGTGWTWDSNSQMRHIGNGGAISILSIDDGGSGYAVGDYIRVNGGSLDSNYRVSSVTSGKVTGLAVVSAGTKYVTSIGNSTTATSGTGTGLFVSIIQIVDGNSLSQAVTTTIGNYFMSFEVKNYSAGGKIRITLGGYSSGYNINNGVFSFLSLNGAYLRIDPTADFNGYIDNVTLFKVNPSSSVLTIDNNDNSVGIEMRPGGNNSYNYFAGTNAGRNTYRTSVANSGMFNTGVGTYALQNNTVGAFNVGVGYSALKNNTTGLGNIAIGGETLRDNTSGSYNEAIGGGALMVNTMGVGNVGFGYQSLTTNKTGSGNVGIGYQTLATNVSGAYNVGIGSQALYKNTTANYNTGIGYASLYSNTVGTGNIGIGFTSLYYNTRGNYNTGIGYQALTSNISGSHNIGIGYTSLNKNTTGTSNVGIGNYTLNGVTTGQQNTGIGYDSLYYLTTQSGNTALGYNAGSGTLLVADYNQRSITDSYSTFLGYQASRDNSAGDSNVTPITNATAIGKNAKVAISNAMVLGGTGSDAVKVGIGTIRPTEVLDVNGDALIRTDLNVLNNSYFGNGKIQIKNDGNIIMYSPDGNDWNCGVTNAGNFVCS